MSKYKVLPNGCSNFNMESFDNLQGLQYTIIDEVEGIDAKDDWLCGVCVVANCPDREQDCCGYSGASRPGCEVFDANEEY